MDEIGRDVFTVLRLCVQGLKLKFFPDCRMTDKSRHKRFVWNSNYLLKMVFKKIQTMCALNDTYV